MAEKKRKLTFIQSFFIAGAVLSVERTVLAPIERVRLVKQAEAELLKVDAISKPYRNIIDCEVKLYKTEGIISFWRGNIASCIRYFPVQVLNFVPKDKIKLAFKHHKADSYSVKLFKNVVSVGVTATLTFSIVYPLDYVRTRLANDVKSSKKGVSEHQFNGYIDVFRKTVATDGPAGLYRGFIVSCVSVFVYRGLQFGIIDKFLVAYGSTVVSTLVSYPIDTVRRRMMTTSCEAVKYNGFLDCIGQILRKEGVSAFYKGLDASLIRAAARACVLPVCVKSFDYFLNT